MEKVGHDNLAYLETDNEKITSNAVEDVKISNNAIEDAENNKTNERATWGNSIEMLMSCIALSIGLGNIWRFPFTAFENGGGAFLIPYVIVLFLVGKPMYYMEMTIGQFASRNSVRMWAILPAFKGTGVAQMVSCFAVMSYYTSLMAITLFYLAMSFSAELPWARCHEDWEDCFDSATSGEPSPNSTSSSELYFTKIVIKQKTIEDGIGTPDWKLTLCLLASWICVFLVMVKGVKSSGKAAYFLAIFPYVIMLVIFIRAVTLEGAVNGIVFFISPQWDKLYSPQVWYAAVTQVFFSLSVAIGALIMFSSYNRFDHKIYRDSMIVTTLDTFTSLLSGFTIFAILGNLAHEKGTSDINSVVGTGGASLAFISYPDAISKFDWVPQLFSVLFFLMLYILGLGTVVALASTFCTILVDRFKDRKYWQMALIACISAFSAGLVYVTPGGQQILTLVDSFTGTFLVLTCAIFQVIGIFGIYGLESFCQDIEFLTKMRISKYWRWCWGLITPLLLFYVFIYAFASLKPISYGDELLPPAAQGSGWATYVIGALQIPIWGFVYYYQNRKSSPKETLKVCFSPIESKWGPQESENKKEWQAFKQPRQEFVNSMNLPKWKHYLYSMNGTYETLFLKENR